MAKTKVQVNLVGEDGNAFAILGRVRKALWEGDYKDLIEQFTKEATSGDYDHLMQVVMEYVEVK